MFFHLTATAYGVSLVQPKVAAALWDSLRRVFPTALAAVIMPDHPHVIVDTDQAAAARRCLAAAASGVARRVGTQPDGSVLRWDVAPLRPPIPNRLHLARDIRYVLLNPCRAGLVADPLEWYWTTHRDVVGAVADPWVTVPHLAAALGRPAAGFARGHHAYVSADSSVRVSGTPLPRTARESSPTSVGLAQLCAAAVAATRSFPESLRRRSTARRLLVQLARRNGWYRPAALAELCGVTRQSIHRLLSEPLAPAAMAAGAMCLGDERLLRPFLTR